MVAPVLATLELTILVLPVAMLVLAMLVLATLVVTMAVVTAEGSSERSLVTRKSPPCGGYKTPDNKCSSIE